jgi:hypothetical protein
MVWRAKSICEGEAELRSWVSAVVGELSYLSDCVDKHQRQLMSWSQAFLEEQISYPYKPSVIILDKRD